MEGIGGVAEAKTSLSLVIRRYFATPLVWNAIAQPKWQKICWGGVQIFLALFGWNSAPDENISAPLKMESVPDKKKRSSVIYQS